MMMPDVNVLVASQSEDHTHHEIAADWLNTNPQIATCAITELGLLRVLIQLGVDAPTAERKLKNFVSRYRARFIECDLRSETLEWSVTGHKQVTDNYLVELCRRHDLTFATMDKAVPGALLINRQSS